MRKVDMEIINVRNVGKCEPRKCEFPTQNATGPLIHKILDVAQVNVGGDSY